MNYRECGRIVLAVKKKKAAVSVLASLNSSVCEERRKEQGVNYSLLRPVFSDRPSELTLFLAAYNQW